MYKTGYKKSINEQQIKELDEFFSAQNPPQKLCYMLMRFLGFRISDATSLRVNEIQEGKIIKMMIKTKRIISIPVPIKLMKYIEAYTTVFRNEIEQNEGFLCFSTVMKGHIKENSMRSIFTMFRRKYGYDKPYYIQKNGRKLYNISCHTLRHYVLTEIYKKTKDIVLCKSIAGHTRAETTMRYYIDDSTEESKKAVLELLT